MTTLYPKLIDRKTQTNQVTTIEWNPSVDLLALVSSTGVTCKRLLSLQELWTKEAKISSVAWRPDGRVLAVGSGKDVTLYDVEDGKEINCIQITHGEVSSVAWHSALKKEHQEDPILPKKPIELTQNSSENFSHQLAHGQTQLNILVISSDNLITFYALGLYRLGEIKISPSLSDQPKILKTYMSPCMRFLTFITTPRSTRQHASLKVLKLSTFHERGERILRVAKIYAKVTDELKYLEDVLSAITTSWTDILAGLDRGGYTSIKADELLQLLVLGFTSENLEKFLVEQNRGLRKLKAAIEQTCFRVQNLIVKNALKCCYHLHIDLNQLKEISPGTKCIIGAMRDVGSLVLKFSELQQVIDHSLKKTRAFFRWMISVASRVSGEQNSNSVQIDANKTTQQEIELVTDFILENFDYNSEDIDLDVSERSDDVSNKASCSNFTLEQVGQYFKNENLSRLKYSFDKPNSNFWIEFFERRPALSEDPDTLLFYPHRSETSLMQEHKRAFQSIEEAFRSTAISIEPNLDGDNLITLKDFVPIGPYDRIRIETDARTMQLFSMFQTKPDPVAKQYLSIHSLTDKTFRMISIEFSTGARGSAGHILIADSCFYEHRAAKKMLLIFLLLDRNSCDTLIVQLELDKVVHRANPAAKGPREVTRIFRNEDSIDKYSSQLCLKIDLHSEPASERKHDLDMVVKKIKSVTAKDMFASSSRGVIAFTSCDSKRLHLYELESSFGESEIIDEEIEDDEKGDESLID